MSCDPVKPNPTHRLHIWIPEPFQRTDRPVGTCGRACPAVAPAAVRAGSGGGGSERPATEIRTRRSREAGRQAVR